MNRSQIEDIMSQRDAEYQRRDNAKENLLSILGTEGITPGSKDYKQVQTFFQEAIQDGRLTPQILLSDAGIRTLVAMSGVAGTTDAGPSSGSRSSPSEMRLGGEGETQLNKEGARANTLDAKMREAMARAARQ